MNNTFVVLDFETGGVDPTNCEVIQVAGLAINPVSLKPIEGVGLFHSLIAPENMDRVEDGALRVNKISRADLADPTKAPPLEVVWDNFKQWINQFNQKPGNTRIAPIMVGYNILGFDWTIYDRLCRKFKMVGKDGKPNLFNDFIKVDLMLEMWWLFDGTSETENLKFDSMRSYFGISSKCAHNARYDVEQEGALFARMKMFHRAGMSKGIPAGAAWPTLMKGAFAKDHPMREFFPNAFSYEPPEVAA